MSYIFGNHKQALSEGKLGTFRHKKAKGVGD